MCLRNCYLQVRNLIYILALGLIFSCSTKEKQLSEKEIYSLLNDSFTKDISLNNQKPILYRFQLNQDFSEIDLNYDFKDEDADDTMTEIVIDTTIPFPKKFTNIQWNQTKMKEFIILDDTIFKDQNDSISSAEILMKEYGTTSIHNISFPYFDSKNKIAIIVDEIDNIENNMQCIPYENTYLYVRADNEWKSLKEFGTENIYLTLYNYKNNTSQQH